jgi:uncharacterized RDD family membrane protein YckC
MGPRVPGAGTDSMANVTPGNVPAWKTELTQKLAASRSRRSGHTGSGRAGVGAATSQPRLPLEGQAEPRPDARASVAAAVAARYAGQPSYREALEQEAAQAALAAEEALMAAQLAQEAVRRRMDDARAAEAAAAEAREQEAQQRLEEERLKVRFAVDERTERNMQAHRQASEARHAAREAHAAQAAAPGQRAMPQGGRIPPPAYVTDPLEEATVAPAIPLAANLIEFPRELVATRKVRPRLAEGPLREEDRPGGQLRIFEVEPDSYHRHPQAAAAGSAAAQPGLDWASIRLDTPHPERAARAAHAGHQPVPISPAPLADRMTAAFIDGCLSLAGFLVFALVFGACTAHPPTGKVALGSAAAALLTVIFGYQWLFFRFGAGTPGMAYARIALCTMDDNNPSRGAMHRRIGALLLAALPLGLGLVWAIFDDDHLGWHDRISGTYQRSYRA